MNELQFPVLYIDDTANLMQFFRSYVSRDTIV